MTRRYCDPPFPAVCLRCGAWLGVQDACPACDSIPSSEDKEFYFAVLAIDREFGRRIWSEPDSKDWSVAVSGGIHEGWGPSVLAIISAIALGVLSNASFDVIKAWLLSRRREYLLRHHVYDYDKVVSVLIEFFRKHPEHFESLRIRGHTVAFNFKPGNKDSTSTQEGNWKP